MRHSRKAKWWHARGDGVVCCLCPHCCQLGPEQPEGRCGLRFWRDGVLHTRGTQGALALHLDPVEKKPLYHFLPGTQTFSLGMDGCNLACKFCQNWSLSASRGEPAGWTVLSASEIAAKALELGAHSVSFTYNEPLIAAEFWIEVAEECHRQGLKTIAVSNGFALPAVVREFFGVMDAANVDLKAFRDPFYRDVCGGHLAPVLRTLQEIKALGSCHLEITNLLVPRQNDDAQEIVEMSRWIAEELGVSVPLHFSAWHPDFLALDWPNDYRTDVHEARRLAMNEGLQFVYTGNVRDFTGSSTLCPGCGAEIILRDGFAVTENRLRQGACSFCGFAVAGCWK